MSDKCIIQTHKYKNILVQAKGQIKENRYKKFRQDLNIIKKYI